MKCLICSIVGWRRRHATSLDCMNHPKILLVLVRYRTNSLLTLMSSRLLFPSTQWAIPIDPPVLKYLPMEVLAFEIVSNRRPAHKIHQTWAHSFDDALCLGCVHQNYCIHVVRTISPFAAFHLLHTNGGEHSNQISMLCFVYRSQCARTTFSTHSVSPSDYILIPRRARGAFRPAQYYIELWHAMHAMPHCMKRGGKKTEENN